MFIRDVKTAVDQKSRANDTWPGTPLNPSRVFIFGVFKELRVCKRNSLWALHFSPGMQQLVRAKKSKADELGSAKFISDL